MTELRKLLEKVVTRDIHGDDWHYDVCALLEALVEKSEQDEERLAKTESAASYAASQCAFHFTKF